MSQAGLLSLSSIPIIATIFDANVGSATPAANILNILGASVAAGSTPVSTSGAGNTITTNVQTSQAIVATDATKIGLAAFNSGQFSVDANGFVSLAGGGLAIDSIAVQATTAPGVSPVVPTAAGLVTINGTAVAAQTIPIQSRSIAVNSLQIEAQRASASAATNATQQGLASFDSASFSVDANGWVQLAGGGLAIDSFQPDSGTNPVVPTAAGLVTMAGSGSITTVGGLNSLTTQLTGLTNHAVLVGAGTTTITKVGPSASTGQILQNNAAADPSYSTATYPSTTAQGDLLSSTSANTIVALAKDTNATRYLSNTGTNNNAAWAQVALATGVSGVLPIANGGTNASSFTQTNGIVAYNGTSLVNYAGPQLSSGGVMTNTSQPAFFFNLTSNTAANLTGDNTEYILGTDALNQIFQQGSGMATNGTFTVPNTGIYYFYVAINPYGLLVTHTQYQLIIKKNGSGENFVCFGNPFTATSSGNITFNGSAILSLAASDTVTFGFTVTGGTKVVGLGGVSGSRRTYIMGYKLA